MRISDWSTDVCSSDLPGEGRNRGGRSHGKAPAGGGTNKGATLVSRRRARKRGQGLFVDLAMKACCGLASSRSEEHTSELQSLMRISYAVFCLKKKKKKYRRNKTNMTQTSHKIKQ